MFQALRAVESVNRFWAKSLGLNPEDILLLLMLAKEEHTATSLSIATGRQRQQTHRSLLRFESVHLIEVAAFAQRGRVSHWRLTTHGRRIVACLERRMEIWEQHLDGRVDVDVLVDQLRAVLRTLVNRRMEGYFAGLYLPREMQNDPNLEFVQEAHVLKEENVRLATLPSPREAREELGRQHAEAVERDAAERSLAAYRRLWE
ncbi:MAG: winged helix-turn-helix transcriptional regulator [Archangium sp.]|nr:winged helix-turn-helix transcriptional regulator [Archangium sp.]